MAHPSSGETKYYDGHTLYVKMGVASQNQLEMAISKACERVSEILKREIKTEHRINIPRTKEGKSFLFAYVWVSNTEVYNMLLGLNPDGKERVEYEKIAEDVPDPEDELDFEAPLDFDTPLCSSWSDLTEAKKPAPVKVTYLSPLMKLPDFTYTRSQKEEIQRMWPDDDANGGQFSVSAAFVFRSDGLHNILYSKNIPPDVSGADLKKAFEYLASDSTTPIQCTVEGVKIMDTYPLIRITNDNTAYVIFSPATNDAGFALHMQKITTISLLSGKQRTLIFSQPGCGEKQKYENNLRFPVPRPRGSPLRKSNGNAPRTSPRPPRKDSPIVSKGKPSSPRNGRNIYACLNV